MARAISLVENSDPLAAELVRELYPSTGRAYAVGVTGPPGVGKSSLIAALLPHVRAQGLSVGVVSVDPSSPFSQGALLGDRIRLADHFLDPEVFIRSMGTRGHLGGLAEATLQAVLLLDAAGKDVVFVETVGTGQSEVEVIGIADTVLLVLMPGSGDSIQALKAGIMEIPDVIAVNKMDNPAAKTMLTEVRSILALDPDRAWRPPIVLTEAARGQNLEQLWKEIGAHIGFALSNIVWLLNPDAIVIGGGVAKAGEWIFGPVRAEIKSRCSPVFWQRLEILPAKLGSDAGLIGAATLALDTARR